MNTWNAGQILSTVRDENKMDMSYLGPDDVSQNQVLFGYMNRILWKLVRLCYNTEVTDVLNITEDGAVAFLKGSSAITNMFEPLRLLKVNDDLSETEAPKRYSDTGPVGWYRESENQPLDCRGLRGNYKLKYIRYPRQVTQESDQVDVGEVGYDALINAISAKIKQTKNYYEEANAMEAKAKEGYNVITQSAISARGPSSGGQPPSYDDVKQVRGG